ncbi:MAG TPA: sigma-70 family RNA polymerase sigma factor, partial [Actinomycetes bacterium]|nr:sigma-70 family RNA polymerase sigma factor [Actinomycetes bacterium]
MEPEELTELALAAAVEAGAGYADVRWVREETEGLTEREVLALRLRFVEELTQSEIAERIGCSQVHVSRILRAALQRLRE